MTLSNMSIMHFVHIHPITPSCLPAPADPSSPQLAFFCFHTFVCVFASATKLMASELPVSKGARWRFQEHEQLHGGCTAQDTPSPRNHLLSLDPQAGSVSKRERL